MRNRPGVEHYIKGQTDIVRLRMHNVSGVVASYEEFLDLCRDKGTMVFEPGFIPALIEYFQSDGNLYLVEKALIPQTLTSGDRILVLRPVADPITGWKLAETHVGIYRESTPKNAHLTNIKFCYLGDVGLHQINYNPKRHLLFRIGGPGGEE